MNLAKTNNELGNVKSDLINTRIELSSKLEGILNNCWIDTSKLTGNLTYMLWLHIATRKETVQTIVDLEKTTAHLREMTDKTVDDLTAELNGILLLKIWQNKNANPFLIQKSDSKRISRNENQHWKFVNGV